MRTARTTLSKDRRVRGASLRQRARKARGSVPRKAGRPTRREAQKQIGNRIRTLRRQHGWTQATLARKCRVDKEIIGQIERGNKNFAITSLRAIANQLQTTLADLFTGI